MRDLPVQNGLHPGYRSRLSGYADKVPQGHLQEYQGGKALVQDHGRSAEADRAADVIAVYKQALCYTDERTSCLSKYFS